MPRLLLLIASVGLVGALATALPRLGATPDGRRALAHLTEAANDGDLDALHRLAVARRRGYVRTPYERGRTQTNHAIWSWPGQALWTEQRFERTLRDGVEAGRAEALFLAADQRLHPWQTGRPAGADPTDADLAEADALFERLDRREPASLRLAFLAKQLRREADYQRLLTEAAARDAQACVFHLTLTFRDLFPEAPADVSRHADFLDAAARCADLPTSSGDAPPDAGRAFVTGLAQQAAHDVEAAGLLAGLHEAGVFDRHPRLGAALTEADGR